jgi:zinc transporter ZupT
LLVARCYFCEAACAHALHFAAGYGGALAAMAYFSVLRVTSPLGGAALPTARGAAAGALTFVVSDTVLALDKFLAPVPNAKATVMGACLYCDGMWGDECAC